MSDVELIRHVQRNQCIYDRSVVDYKNPEAKELVWESIAEKLQIPVPEVKKRWKNIRDRFSREHREHRDNPDDCPWPLMHNLKFLAKHIIPRNSYRFWRNGRKSEEPKTTASQSEPEEDSTTETTWPADESEEKPTLENGDGESSTSQASRKRERSKSESTEETFGRLITSFLASKKSKKKKTQIMTKIMMLLDEEQSDDDY